MDDAHLAADGPTSTVVLTFLDEEGKEWTAGATLTRLRPKGALRDPDVVSVQLTQERCADWRLKEFKVVIP